MISERLLSQMAFILEVDKIKNIFRQTSIHDGSRRENDAEHSWHLALMAIVLSEYAKDAGLDLLKVLKMAIIHDIVEIDAGDTFCYDTTAGLDKLEREEAAADRIFGLLPPDQRDEFRSLWEEFDKMESPEAAFAAALDRLQPVSLNYLNNGGTWQEHSILKQQVIKRNMHIENGAPKLWEYASHLIEDAVQKGYLKE